MSLQDDLKNSTIEIECDCGHEFSIQLKQIGTTVTCPKCKTEIALSDDGAISEIENAEDLINQTVKNLFK